MSDFQPCCIMYPKPLWNQEKAKADFLKHHKQGQPAKIVPRDDAIFIHHVVADLGVTFLIGDETAQSAP